MFGVVRIWFENGRKRVQRCDRSFELRSDAMAWIATQWDGGIYHIIGG
jgi:hypothetical protein